MKSLLPYGFSGGICLTVERDEDGFYIASVLEIRGCHNQAKSMNTLLTRVKEAISLCLDMEQEQPSRNEFVGGQRVIVES